jgi:hypothetical protein
VPAFIGTVWEIKFRAIQLLIQKILWADLLDAKESRVSLVRFCQGCFFIQPQTAQRKSFITETEPVIIT